MQNSRTTDRLNLTQAYEQWRAAQPGGAEGTKTMILVAVQGGASRAGYWTAAALSSLREAAKANGVEIDPHILAISSVSGGSVGAVSSRDPRAGARGRPARHRIRADRLSRP